ncbi:MAG: M28 family metallopeptidase [Caldilineaceae bacterium]
MCSISLANKASAFLDQLCYGFGSRRTGTDGNRRAADYFAKIVSQMGYEVECPKFVCIDWEEGGVSLQAGSQAYQAFVSPYALGCDVHAELVAVSSVLELEQAELTGKVVLLSGEIAREQLMPKKFVFYNPDHHQHIIRLLEKKRPAAIISATTRDAGTAGGVYPFSLIEDGDFDVPSVYMTAEEGIRLAQAVGRRIDLCSYSRRIPSTAWNVIARKRSGSLQKITICAHIDTKDNTPGALDNGTGVVVLMLLSELLSTYDGKAEVEIVALNGEDYYSAAGEMQYWNDYAHDFDRIALAINIDAAGYIDGATAYSLYGCHDDLAALSRSTMQGHAGLVEGEPWFQSDHSMFIQRGRPALALTSAKFWHLTSHVTHTAKDTPELVDAEKVVTVAAALRDLVCALGRSAK